MSLPARVMLGDIAEFINGDRGKNYPSKSGFVPSGIPFINAGHLVNGEVDFAEMNYISEEQFRKLGSGKTQQDDILYCLRGSLGKTAVMKHGGSAAIASSLVIIRPSKACSARYIYRYLTSPLAESQLRQFDNGSSQPNLSATSVKKYQVPLPPLEEQRRIAEVLDRADALRQKRRLALQKLDTLLQSVFLDMFGDPLTNSQGLTTAKLGDIVDFQGGSQPPKSTFVYEPREGYVRLIQIRDYKSDRFLTFIPEKLAKRSVSKEDVMISRYGPPVFQILKGLEGSYNVALMKAVPKKGLTHDFLFYLLQDRKIQRMVVENSQRTAGQTGVNLDLLNNLMVPVPTTEEQVRFSTAVVRIENLRVKLSESRVRYEKLFESAQQRAFAGQLFEEANSSSPTGTHATLQQTSYS